MLKILIPRSKYNTTDYPNLEERADGLVIPELWGIKTNIIPVCIDTTNGDYKISKRILKAIDAIRADGIALTGGGVDYTADLANGEFNLLITPKLSASTTYYIVIEGDFGIDGANYVDINGDADEGYAGGTAYHISNLDAWSAQSADIRFRVYGKDTIDGSESLKVSFTQYTEYWPGELRKANATTKLAMSFTTPAGNDFYVSRILLYGRAIGAPSGNIWVSIHSDQVGTQVGLKSNNYDVANLIAGEKVIPITFPQRGIPTYIEVDAQGYYEGADPVWEDVADILEDICLNIVGMATTDLDAAAFAALDAARTEDLCIYLDSEKEFGSFTEKLEAGQLFKFMPQLDGTHAPIFYAAGEPAGTPHLRDEDFKSFKCIRNLSSVKQTYRIKYNRNPSIDLYLEKEATSEIAEYLYRNHETLEIETYLKDAGDAATLATTYKGLLEYPQREIEFEVSSYLMDKIPTDKVKITRSRADSATGSFSAILFRILSLTKNQATGTVVCRAVLDSQTY